LVQSILQRVPEKVVAPLFESSDQQSGSLHVMNRVR
jgi:hypothetical protein